MFFFCYGLYQKDRKLSALLDFTNSLVLLLYDYSSNSKFYINVYKSYSYWIFMVRIQNADIDWYSYILWINILNICLLSGESWKSSSSWLLVNDNFWFFRYSCSWQFLWWYIIIWRYVDYCKQLIYWDIKMP